MSIDKFPNCLDNFRIDGTSIAKDIKHNIKMTILEKNITATLAVIMIGDKPDSKVYVNHKIKACQEVGINSIYHHLPENINEQNLILLVEQLNKDKNINGILIQLPFPAACLIDQNKILSILDTNKDVDCLTPTNIARLMQHGVNAPLISCTPLGLIKLLDHIKCPIEGQVALVVGRSQLVGKPVAQLLLNRNATVIQCHSKSKNIPNLVALADIVIVAIGKPKWLKGSWLKPGAVVLDVGMNIDPNNSAKLCGDVDYESTKSYAKAVTPVPGGVGPMTVAMLLNNTLKAYELQTQITEIIQTNSV